MIYEDKNIVADYAEAKRLAPLNIELEVNIDGIIYIFKDRKLFDGAFSMVLPVSFEPMDEIRAKIKYPSEYRPDIILSDETGNVNFTFSYFVDVIQEEDQVLEMSKEFRSAYKRMNPADVFMERGEIKSKNVPVAFYEYRGSAFDADIYNLAFVSSIGDKLLFGTFNCLYKQRQSWKPLVKQMLGSIMDLINNR